MARCASCRPAWDRWLVAGGARGGPLSPGNAWALIGLASGDQALTERCLGLLERPEELSRTRARLGREKLVDLAPRLRRRATLIHRQVPQRLRQALERDAALVRTGAGAASAYGWDELGAGDRSTWRLDAHLSVEVFSKLQEQLNALNVDGAAEEQHRTDSVLLRVVDAPWPFPPNYPIAAQPLAALDLLEYPDQVARRLAGEALHALPGHEAAGPGAPLGQSTRQCWASHGQAARTAEWTRTTTAARRGRSED